MVSSLFAAFSKPQPPPKHPTIPSPSTKHAYLCFCSLIQTNFQLFSHLPPRYSRPRQIKRVDASLLLVVDGEEIVSHAGDDLHLPLPPRIFLLDGHILADGLHIHPELLVVLLPADESPDVAVLLGSEVAQDDLGSRVVQFAAVCGLPQRNCTSLMLSVW